MAAGAGGFVVLVAALAALAVGAEPGRWMAGVAVRTAVPAGMLLFGAAAAKTEVVAATLARPGPTASPAPPSESKPRGPAKRK